MTMNKTRNKFEQKLHTQLKRSKVKFEYEPEKIPYIFSGHYIPDFIIYKGLDKMYIEAKGHFRPEAKRKMVAVHKLHPTLDIRIIFYSFKAKDVRWAEKNGFPYAIGTIPEEWLT
jgi:predicted nuclease of restriction endonuclease-like RecB superfamily